MKVFEGIHSIAAPSCAVAVTGNAFAGVKSLLSLFQPKEDLQRILAETLPCLEAFYATNVKQKCTAQSVLKVYRLASYPTDYGYTTNSYSNDECCWRSSGVWLP